MAAPQQAQHDTLERREGGDPDPRGHLLEPDNLVIDAVVQQVTSIRRHDVAVPVDLRAVGAVELGVIAERSRDPSAD
jgi:hypothetical protein